MPQHHLTAPRGSEIAPRSVFLDGRFGRMFRNLPSFVPPDDALDALGAQMLEAADPGTSGDGEGDETLDNPRIPAGYTYLGQFVDHDITFDPVSSLQRLNDPEALHDFRTPRFDLDSLYGDGPNNNPFMYDPDIDGGKTAFLLGKNADGEDDLPRNVVAAAPDGQARGRALIGDPRNDENVIVSQLQLLFLKFHNKVVDHVRAEQPGLDPDHLFEEAQRLVRWHYQWIVSHDFLGRIVGTEVIDDIITPESFVVVGNESVSLPRVRLHFYRWQHQPFMPVEFSVAAYRFGHSMIRPDYRINTTIQNEIPIFTASVEPGEHEDLRGFRPLPTQWEIDWSFFFEFGDPAHLQQARRIDTKLSAPLQTLPGLDPAALAVRNLRRSAKLGLPSGQRVARAMAIEPLSDEELGIVGISDQFVDSAPLWFYVLKEAESRTSGETLGPVGGRIVAEVLLGLLKGDSFSFINVEPAWQPFLPAATEGEFTMADLIRFTLGEPAPPPAPEPGPDWQSQQQQQA